MNIIHDYVFHNAINMCSEHGGFHYILQINDISKKENYPCKETIKIRCQDGSLLNFDSGIGYCFIGELQLEETLNETK